MRSFLADPERQAAFDAKGYVRVPMLAPEQLAALMTDIATLRPADGFAPDGTGFARNSYHCTFLDSDPGYKRATFDLLHRHFRPVIERYLVGYRFLLGNFYVKPPGQGDFPIHQNWPVLEDLAATSVTLWCPLVDVDVANGTLHVVPASHKLLQHVEGPNSPAYFAAFVEQMRAQMMPLPAPAGEGFIFDDSIVHGSPPNNGSGPRIAVQIVAVPEDMVPVFFLKDGETRFEIIDAGPDFYLEQGVGDLIARQPHWRGRGHVESRNRPVDQSEFLTLLSQQKHIDGDGTLPAVSQPKAEPQQRRTPRQQARRIAAAVVPDRVKPVIRRLLGRGPRPPEPLRMPEPPKPSPIRDARQPATGHDVGRVRAYYEEMTSAYVAGFGEIFQGSRPESTEELLDYLVDAASIEDGMRVLDAGCGVGGPALGIAARRAVTIEGVTLAATQAAEAARRIQEQDVSDRVTIRQGDFHALEGRFEPESFDRVLFLESLCHAEDYAQVLAGAHRVLKIGGGLYIKDFYCVDNRDRPSMAAGQIADLEKLNSLYRLQLPDLASIVDLLSRLGFIIRYMRMPAYQASYAHWAAYEQLAGAAWNPSSAEPGDIIQAVEFFCWKR